MAVKKPDYILDVADERLWKGRDQIPMTNKAFQLLRYLVEKKNRLVTKDEVLDAIWGDVFVTDGLVREYVHDIRVALDDDPRAPRFIETVPRRGYRYLGGIEIRNHPASASESDRRGRPVVFVHPFQNLSETERGGVLARGITDDLITDLARLPDIAIVSVPPAKLDRPSYEIEGAVQVSEKRLRVNARLSNAGGSPIWSERYDREIGDFLEIQKGITGRMASSIVGSDGPLSLAERRRLNRRPPMNLEAWELYRLAFDLEIVFRRDWTQRALALAKEAVRIDPEFARGWLVFGWVHWQIALEGWCEPGARKLHRQKSLDAYERAARLDPLDPVAQMELSVVKAVRGEPRNARAALERAMDIGHRQADVQISCANYVASILGETDRAETILEDSLSLLRRRTKMHSLSILRVAVFNRNFSKALDAGQFAPDFLQTRVFRALAIAGLGDDASEAARGVYSRTPSFDARSYLQDHPISNDSASRTFLALCRKAGLQAQAH